MANKFTTDVMYLLYVCFVRFPCLIARKNQRGSKITELQFFSNMQHLFSGGSRKSSSGKDHASIVAHAVHQLSQSPAPS